MKKIKKDSHRIKKKSRGLDLGFKHWKIRNKVFFGFIVIILALVYVTFSSYQFIGVIANTFIPVIETQSQLSATVQSMNATQRDFFLIDRTNEAFFKEASKLPEGELAQTERTLAFSDFYESAIANLETLKSADFIKSNQGLMSQLSALEAELNNYKTQFHSMHASVQKRGYDAFGVVGKIDTIKRQLKTKLAAMPQDSNLDKAIANLDIAHVNYLYTQAPKYLDQIKDQLGYPNTQVMLGDFTDSYKADYKAISDGYVAAFAELVALDDEIGRSATEGYFGAISASSQQVEALSTEFNQAVKDDLNDEIGKLIGSLLLIVGAIIIAMLGFAFILATLISKPINNVNHMLKDISEGEGDLTKRLEIQTREEMGTMAGLFNQFASKIRDVVAQVKTSAGSLTNYTDEIHDAIEQANDSIEQINVEVQSMIDGLQNNASVVEQTTASIQELSSSAQMISKEADLVVGDSNEVLRASKQGVDKLNRVVESVEQVKLSSESMYQVIETLKQSSDEIVGIVNLINAIADQTSLLALNASIEAARAGEHGRGFSVVAEEVRKLAEQSKTSAFQINGIIEQISNDIHGAGQTMSKERLLVERSVKEAHETHGNFNQILTLIEGINLKITNISQGAGQQSQISEEMAKAIDELSDIMQGNVASSERIGSNIENQVATFEEIAASISELKNMATILESETNRFKVG
ncbi:MAG: methyl-accepting chemotaxis protein [Firmicutes bacterium]|nr:methyl-accepting chemotaxis protein [Bacillota bacterium]